MGLFSGDERGFFNPQKDITRAEFVQVLYNALAPEDYVPAGTSFTDIKTGTGFTPLCWAEELGVVSGYEDGGFHPSGLISREEMCVVLNNYMQSITGGTAPQDEGFQFPDDSRISSWARKPSTTPTSWAWSPAMRRACSTLGTTPSAARPPRCSPSMWPCWKASPPESSHRADGSTCHTVDHRKADPLGAAFPLFPKENGEIPVFRPHFLLTNRA